MYNALVETLIEYRAAKAEEEAELMRDIPVAHCAAAAAPACGDGTDGGGGGGGGGGSNGEVGGTDAERGEGGTTGDVDRVNETVVSTGNVDTPSVVGELEGAGAGASASGDAGAGAGAGGDVGAGAGVVDVGTTDGDAGTTDSDAGIGASEGVEAGDGGTNNGPVSPLSPSRGGMATGESADGGGTNRSDNATAESARPDNRTCTNASDGAADAAVVDAMAPRDASSGVGETNSSTPQRPSTEVPVGDAKAGEGGGGTSGGEHAAEHASIIANWLCVDERPEFSKVGSVCARRGLAVFCVVGL